MKRLIWFFVVLILTCLSSASVGFLVGARYGGNRVTTVRAASAIVSFEAIKHLKAGDLPKAIDMLQSHCFADSAAVLTESGWRSEAFRKIMVPSLITYRHCYRTNQANWTPTEKRLEVLLVEKL